MSEWRAERLRRGCAVGRALRAVVHGWIWAVSYFLYLPFTVTYVVYDMLPPVFPGISAYRSSLELVVPVVIVAIMLLPVRAMLAGLGLLAAVQLVLMVVLAVIEFSHSRAHLTSHPELADTGKATGNTALLFVCASLPLYLGAEVCGGSKDDAARVAGGGCGRRRCIPGRRQSRSRVFRTSCATPRSLEPPSLLRPTAAAASR